MATECCPLKSELSCFFIVSSPSRRRPQLWRRPSWIMNFGQIGMMRDYGNPAIQKSLAQIRSGAKQAAFLMTKPQSGSDLSQFSTSFRLTTDGAFISGTKDWITGAARRQLFVTLAKEDGSAKHFGLFLIDREATRADSIRIMDRKNKLGLRGLGEYRVELENVFVPRENFVIEPFSAARETLAGDATGVPAAIAKYVCTELAVEATTKLSRLCGGNGLSDKLPLERQMRDMRMLTVAGGASEVLQATIAQNLGRLLAPQPAYQV